MDRGAWQDTVYRVAKSQAQLKLLHSMYAQVWYWGSISYQKHQYLSFEWEQRSSEWEVRSSPRSQTPQSQWTFNILSEQAQGKPICTQNLPFTLEFLLLGLLFQFTNWKCTSLERILEAPSKALLKVPPKGGASKSGDIKRWGGTSLWADSIHLMVLPPRLRQFLFQLQYTN